MSSWPFIRAAMASNFIKAFMLPKSKKKPQKLEYPAFTNFTIQLDVKGSWQDTMKLILKNVQGVTNFRMENDGKINISGYIDPTLLLKCLKKAGKEAQIVHWQYGECSSNLFEKPAKAESPKKNNENKSEGYYIYPSCGGSNGYGYGNRYENGFGNRNGNGYGNVLGNGNGYGYNNGYERNCAFSHLECGGNAEDCSGHHIEKPTNSEHDAEKPRNL